MRRLLAMAWHDLWRRPRRTLINMSAVGVGLFLVILYSSLMAGFMGSAKDDLDDTGMGHVEISAHGWRAREEPSKAMTDPQALMARLALPPGSQVGARVVGRALGSSAHGNQGVEVDGVDPKAEGELSAYFNDVRQGKRLAPGDDKGVVIGEKLAKKLKLGLDGRLRLMVQRADGEMGAGLYRVRGIFHSISPAISGERVLLTMPASQALYGLGDQASVVIVQLSHPEQADDLAERIGSALGPSFDVVSYGRLLPELKKMESLISVMQLGIALFVYFLVGLGILNTTLMSVMERTREFGVMMALGTRSRRIVALVFGEAFWIATLSVAVGLTAGLLVSWFGQTHVLVDFGKGLGEGFDFAGTTMRTAVKLKLSVPAAIQASVLVYALALVVGIYPAWRVTRLQPAQALRAA